MSRVKIPKSKIPTLSDQLSPEEVESLEADGYEILLELIDLLNETMWESVQEDGWSNANERLSHRLEHRIGLLPENQSKKLLSVLKDWLFESRLAG